MIGQKLVNEVHISLKKVNLAWRIYSKLINSEPKYQPISRTFDEFKVSEKLY